MARRRQAFLDRSIDPVPWMVGAVRSCLVSAEPCERLEVST
jgi:hypothetical protein